MVFKRFWQLCRMITKISVEGVENENVKTFYDKIIILVLI